MTHKNGLGTNPTMKEKHLRQRRKMIKNETLFGQLAING